MRELAFRIPGVVLEDVLDVLLPLAPRGVHEVQRDDKVEVRLRGDELPRAAVEAVLAPWDVRIAERTLSDDWRERRKADFEPLVVAGRVALRPQWAPVSDGVVNVVFADDAAFGSGGHPTTRACVELLVGLDPAGGFADLGCGSGVLAVAARLLGWAPVLAIDVDPAAVEATRRNAVASGADLEASLCDLLSDEGFPEALTMAANVPQMVHLELAGRLSSAERLVVSGIQSHEAAETFDRYRVSGFEVVRRLEYAEWVAALLVACVRAR